MYICMYIYIYPIKETQVKVYKFDLYELYQKI